MTRLSPRRWGLALAALLVLPAVSFAGGDGASASDLHVAAVGHDTAQVTGNVTPGDDATQWWFEYGPTVKDTKATPRTNVGSDDDNASAVAVSAVLPALAPDTRYYVRLVAQSAGHATHATKTKAFTTASAPVVAPPTPGEPPAPVAEPPVPPAPPAEPSEPEAGVSVVAAPAGGEVLVRLPGSGSFAALGAGEAIPVGSIVDASRGSVTLTAALDGGATQNATFGGSRFAVRQRADGGGYVNLHLRGGDFSACPSATRSLSAATATARSQPRRRVRNLWGRDRGGRFRTHGRDSVATVRGTKWTMTDRCDGTLTTVREGAVDVRVRSTGRVVRVRAGQRHLARHH